MNILLLIKFGQRVVIYKGLQSYDILKKQPFHLVNVCIVCYLWYSGVLSLPLKLVQCIGAVPVGFCPGGSGLWFDCFHPEFDHPAMVSLSICVSEEQPIC